MKTNEIIIVSYGFRKSQALYFDRWINGRERSVFVSSDTHGQINELHRLLNYMEKDDILVLTGDLIDRGSEDVFSFLKSLNKTNNDGLTMYNGRFILFQQGNHEEFLIDFLVNLLYTAMSRHVPVHNVDHFLNLLTFIDEDDPRWGSMDDYWRLIETDIEEGLLWVHYNGGEVTIKNLCNNVTKPKQLLDICLFFRNMPLYSIVTIPVKEKCSRVSENQEEHERTFQLVHAGPGNPLNYQGRRQILWNVPEPGMKTIENCHCDYLVHGHLITDYLFPELNRSNDHMHIVFDPIAKKPKRIAIDTGCGLKDNNNSFSSRGILSSLRLNDLKPVYFQTKKEKG